MKSFIFGIILFTSFSCFADSEHTHAAVVTPDADAETAATPNPTTSEAGIINTESQRCKGEAEIKCINGRNTIQYTFSNSSNPIANDGTVHCDENNNVVDRDIACRLYTSQRLSTESQRGREIAHMAESSTSVPQIDDLIPLSEFRGMAQVTLNCSDVELSSESDKAKLLDFELFEANGDKLLSIQGCDKVLGTNFESKNNSVEAIISDDTARDPRKKLCLAYAQGYCNEAYNNCKQSAGDDPAACNTLKTSCFIIDEAANKKAAAMISTCSAVQKAHKNIAHLDTETDDQEDNYVTVDSDSQGGNSRGGFNCRKGPGKMALDYKSCKKAAHAFNAGFVGGDILGELGVQTYGAIQGPNDAAAAGREATSGEPGAQQSAALEAKRRTHILQRNQHMARAGIQGAKGASMLAFMRSYVTPKKVKKDWCLGNEGGSSNENSPLTVGESCALIYMVSDGENNNSKNRINQSAMMNVLFPNRGIVSKMGESAAGSFAQALVSGVMAALQDKQAKMVGQVKDEFENANFNQPQTGIATEGLPTFCSENPTAPSCKAINPNANTGGSGFQIDFGGVNSTPNEIAFGSEDLLSEDEQRELANATRDAVDSIPDLTNGTSGGKGNSDLTAIAPGEVSSSKRSGGGGGGGGSAGGGGGGSAGPDPSKKTADANQGPLGKKTGIKYSGGSSGSFTGGGSAKKKSSSNPFDKLTGNRSNRTVASQVEKKLLPKDIKLFGAISKRYSEVSRSGRLENIK